MAVFNRYPYTNFQEMNLDWILQQMKDLTDEWAVFENQYQGITAEASTVPYGMGASVTVTGGDGTPFNFDFSIPAGKDLKLVSTLVRYGTSADTSTVPATWYDQIPTVAQGDYLWTRVTLTFNDGTQSSFYSVARNGLDGLGSVVTVNNVSPDGNGNVTLPMPQPSDNTPLMDTTLGSEGVSNDYSRADHQHISDTSKLNVQTGTQAGDLNAYVVQDISTQTKMPISSGADANAIARYTANGTLVVAEPQTVYEAPRLLDVQNGFVSNTDISNYVAKTDLASDTDLGIVQVDGSTIVADSDGIISALPSGVTFEELYVNGTPNATISTATLSPTNMANYEYFIFVVMNANDIADASRRYVTMVVKKEIGKAYKCDVMYGNSLCSRSFLFNASTVEVEQGYYYNAMGSATTSNAVCIPIALYGFK